ncbi:MAG: hypothetical protein FJX76_09415 [Armatimonadetes bacterium]|nr:hypothetical protein [Armatimonadota bacterium]
MRIVAGGAWLILLLALVGWPAHAATVLTLEEAIGQALAHNRQLNAAKLRVTQSKHAAKAVRAQQFPNVQINAQAGRQLTPINFRFEQGVFGTYPIIGPIPGTATAVTAPPEDTFFLDASITQPLTQLTRIGLNARIQERGTDIATENARAAPGGRGPGQAGLLRRAAGPGGAAGRRGGPRLPPRVGARHDEAGVDPLRAALLHARRPLESGPAALPEPHREKRRGQCARAIERADGAAAQHAV